MSINIWMGENVWPEIHFLAWNSLLRWVLISILDYWSAYVNQLTSLGYKKMIMKKT